MLFKNRVWKLKYLLENTVCRIPHQFTRQCLLALMAVTTSYPKGKLLRNSGPKPLYLWFYCLAWLKKCLIMYTNQAISKCWIVISKGQLDCFLAKFSIARYGQVFLVQLLADEQFFSLKQYKKFEKLYP